MTEWADDPQSRPGGLAPTDGPDGGGLGALAGGMGGMDLGSLFGMASDMIAAQQAAADEELIGSSGGGVVQITVTGGGEFTRVRILPDAVDPSDPSMLEDLVLAALRDAMAQVQELQSSAMGGLDLGSLGGLLGGGVDQDAYGEDDAHDDEDDERPDGSDRGAR